MDMTDQSTLIVTTSKWSSPSHYFPGMMPNDEDLAALAANPLTGSHGNKPRHMWRRGAYGWTFRDGYTVTEFGDAFLAGAFPGIKPLGQLLSDRLRELRKAGELPAGLPFGVTSNTTGIGYGITVRFGDHSRHADNQMLWKAACDIALPYRQRTTSNDLHHQEMYRYVNFHFSYA
jgi:hypothetical protein